MYTLQEVVSFPSPVMLLSETFFRDPYNFDGSGDRFDPNRIQVHEFRTTWTFARCLRIAANTLIERWSFAVCTGGFEKAFWRLVSGQSRNTAVRLEGVR